MSRITKEIVTPQKAKVYLNQNKNSRLINQEKVNRFVEILISGRWNSKLGHLDFSSDGYLINGQHRLTAIVLSGICAEIKIIHC